MESPQAFYATTLALSGATVVYLFAAGTYLHSGQRPLTVFALTLFLIFPVTLSLALHILSIAGLSSIASSVAKATASNQSAMQNLLESVASLVDVPRRTLDLLVLNVLALLAPLMLVMWWSFQERFERYVRRLMG